MNASRGILDCVVMDIGCRAQCASVHSGCVQFANYVQIVTTPLSVTIFVLSGAYIIHGGKRTVNLIRKIAYRCIYYKRLRAEEFDIENQKKPAGKMKISGKIIKVTKTLAKPAVSIIIGGIIYLIPQLIKEQGCPSILSGCVSICASLFDICESFDSYFSNSLTSTAIEALSIFNKTLT